MGRDCYYCRKNRNSAFCNRFGNEKKEKPERTRVSTLEVKSAIDHKIGEALLPAVKAVISNPFKEELKKETHLFYDSGRQCSVISNKLAQELNLPVIRRELLMLHTFAARNSLKCYLLKVELTLHLCDGT